MRLFVPVLVFFLSSTVGARSLIGEWRVDVEKSVKFNSEVFEHSRLALQIFRCMAGNEKLLVGEETIKHVIEKSDCSFEDKSTEIEGWLSVFSYKIIYETDHKWVLVKSREGDGEAVQVIHWIGSDLFWFDELSDEDGQKEMRYFFYRK